MDGRHIQSFEGVPRLSSPLACFALMLRLEFLSATDFLADGADLVRLQRGLVFPIWGIHFGGLGFGVRKCPLLLRIPGAPIQHSRLRRSGRVVEF